MPTIARIQNSVKSHPHFECPTEASSRAVMYQPFIVRVTMYATCVLQTQALLECYVLLRVFFRHFRHVGSFNCAKIMMSKRALKKRFEEW